MRPFRPGRHLCLLLAVLLGFPLASAGGDGAEEALAGFALVCRHGTVPAGGLRWVDLADAPVARPSAGESPLVVFVRRRLPVQRSREAPDWARGLTESARGLRGSAAVWVLDLRPESTAEGEEEGRAFLFKQGSVAVRAGDPKAAVFLGGVEDPDLLGRLYDHELAAYVDGVVMPLAREAGGPAEAAGVLAQRDVTARLWGEASEGEDPAGSALTDLAGGAEGTVLPQCDAALGRFSQSLPGSFSTRSARLAPGGVAGAGLSLFGEGPEVLFVRLLDLKTFATVILYRSAGEAAAGMRLRLAVDVTGFGKPALEDLATGEPLSPGLVVEEPREGTTRFDLPRASGHVVAVRFAEAELVERGERAERVQVRGEALPPVERVLAAYQAWKADQDSRLEAYWSDLFTDMRFQVTGSGRGAALGIRSRLFFERGRPLVYENEEYFVNGVPIKSKKIPNLPLVQPEKVQTLPLEIILGKAYRYRLLGKEKEGGRQAWVVAFEPLEGTTPAYRGEVWIDTQTWERLRLHVVQTGLEPPLLAYEQTEHDGVWESPAGSFRLPSRIEIEQTFTTLGATVTAKATEEFRSYEINPPRMKAQIADAEASEHQMLQDTDEGLRYLVKDPRTGERVLQEQPTRKARFWLAGIRYDRSLDYPVPLGGVNLLNFDWKGRGIQTNAFLAGLFNRFTVSQPSLGDSRWGASGQMDLTLIPLRDRAYDERGRERKEEDVRALQESMDLSLWRPLGQFFRLTGSLDLDYTGYRRAKETEDGFVLPEDNLTTSLLLTLDYRRAGWSVEATASRSSRSSWEAWGPEGDLNDPEAERDFERYGLTVSKDWRLRTFQVLGFSAEYMGGSDLDRFSRYSVGAFSTPLGGFTGSGLRWDEGTIARLRYGWSVLQLAGLTLELDWARVRNDEVSDAFFDNTGISLEGSFTGPKGTVMNFQVGYALQSNLFPDAEGDVTLQFLLLKLF